MSLPMSKLEASTMIAKLVDEASQNININSNVSEQAACSYELGQKLMDKLVSYDVDAEAEALGFEQEEILRSGLPFVNIPDGPYRDTFCIKKIFIAIMLGVIFGLAIAEALGLKGAWAILGAGLGASLSVFLKHYMENTKNRSEPFMFLEKSFSYKSLRRMFKLLLMGIIVLTILRDFFQQNPFLQAWIESLRAFIMDGSSLALWSSIYNVVIMSVIFSLCLKQKTELDVYEFKNRLLIASVAWWTSAILCRAMVVDMQNNEQDEKQLILDKVAKDIYLFANELPINQQKWLIEHLNMLGISISRPEGELVWSEELALEYEAIGYLQAGDACYVDTPAVVKAGLVVSKGVVRKIR